MQACFPRMRFKQNYALLYVCVEQFILKLLNRDVLILDRLGMLGPRRQHPTDVKVTHSVFVLFGPFSGLEATVEHLDDGVGIRAEEERDRVPALARHVADSVHGRDELAVGHALEKSANVADKGVWLGFGGNPDTVLAEDFQGWHAVL